MLKPYFDRRTVKPQSTSTVLPMAPVIHLTGDTPVCDCKFAESKLQKSVTLKNFSQKLVIYLGAKVVR